MLKWRYLLASVLCLTFSCRATNNRSEVQDAGGNALLPGIPKFYLGVMNLVSGETKFDSGFSISSSVFTGQMSPIPGTGGQQVVTPIQCSVAEEWATGSSTSTSGKLCHVELVGTGRISPDLNGAALHVIPLDGQGNGFNSSTFTPTTAPLTPGSIVSVSAGPSSVPNSGIDENVVNDAIQRLKDRFKLFPNGKLAAIGQDCLKNARAGSWTDVQAHYYCLMPYTIRFCYSSILGEQKNPVKAYQYCSASSNDADWRTNRDPMFHPYAPGSADWQWLVSDQENVFKYIMFTQQGVKDYNLEDQNAVVNEIYKASSSRPRRAVDTYPLWSKAQPRYDAVRGGTSTTPVLPPVKPTPVNPGQPSPGSNKPAKPTAGLYAEENSLESINCTVRLDSIEENTSNGLRFLLKMTGGTGCTLKGSVISSGVKGTISCISANVPCKYETKLVTGKDFVRDAEVLPNGKIVVFPSSGADKYIWSRIAP